MIKIKCLWHDETVASLAIYTDHYHCYSCGRHGSLEDISNILGYIPEVQDNHRIGYKPMIESIDRQEIDDFLKSRNISKMAATVYGVKGTAAGLYLPCYDFKGKIWGYQIRRLHGEPKYINTSIRPHFYGYSSVGDTRLSYRIVIVESIIDGLSLWSREPLLCWIALLGIHLRGGVISNLNYKADIHIFLDPDVSVVAYDIYDRLKIQGFRARVVEIGKKPYEVTDIQEVFD